jgi:3-phenylpropionate/trans-cinnamate dioxygenase ferredoxin subunit
VPRPSSSAAPAESSTSTRTTVSSSRSTMPGAFRKTTRSLRSSPRCEASARGKRLERLNQDGGGARWWAGSCSPLGRRPARNSLAKVTQAPDANELPFLDVCSTSDAPLNTVVAVEAPGRKFLIANAGGSFYAVAERCTHAAWSLANSELRGCEIVCALHGARFDLRTGAPTAAPASKPLQVFPLRVRGDRLEVQVTPQPR